MKNEPFQREALVDKPGIVGAKWWHAALVDEQSKVARRKAIKQILIGGAVVAGLGALLTVCVKAASKPSSTTTTPPTSSGVDTTDGRSAALALQRDYGWSFGANGEALVFDGTREKPFDPTAAKQIADVLTPAEPNLVPWYQTTLFSASYATPAKISQMDSEDAQSFKQLYPLLEPKVSEAMKTSYARGRSFASLFAALKIPAKVAVVVDLPGPEAVAFAAGAAHVFEPVCLFDNWPHPRGVVKAHQTLAAALYYEPLFAKEKRKGRMPMFVLDRNRLAAYADESTQFDNRYVAKLPWPGTAIKALGGDHVLYVAPTTGVPLRELDDLNDDFVAFVKDGVDVRIVGVEWFLRPASKATGDAGASDAGVVAPTPDAGPARDGGVAEIDDVYYTGSPRTQLLFFEHYPVAKNPPPVVAPGEKIEPPPGASYVPTPRKTTYSSGNVGGTSVKPRPADFATVPIVIAATTGAVLGYRYARSGSWNRSNGGGWAG